MKDDPFSLMQVTSNVTAPMALMPIQIEEIADETIQLLCEKLALADAKVEMAEKDSLRLLWLEERLGVMDRRLGDEIFGDSSWTSIRDAIDTAMAKARSV